MGKEQSRVPQTDESRADASDLRAAIVSALGTRPIRKRTLRAAIWSYVGNERRAASPAAEIIAELTAMIDASASVPAAARQEVTRQVILWCVEEYFGHLGGDPLKVTDVASADGVLV